MDRKSIRALAAGMLFGALLMFSITYFTAEEEIKASEDNTAKEDHIYSEEGTITLTAEEHEALLAQIQEWENRVIELSTAQDNAEGETAAASVMTRYILKIESGMSFPDVSKKLAEYEIIQDASSLNDYLTDNQLTDLVKIGEYEVHSNMTVEEIGTLITN
ncbi:hypothetical protein [Jeotgalibacillus proteolyticus]|uniref:Aminodeoxychorismate lyase n=1 Tax=Jeotgalibacillus proteolyticus TaxID=2082395 RepID=A0A2S5GEJ2_9BACL|nr:hypothetical protein [Jeotgalibacillus proteolyticus]PPA71416.1 hypothetical protein C4B60_04955 [Jeotgalibacillus proteolyticus]